MKTCSEAIIGVRFRLRIFGVPVNTAANVLCVNEAVVNNFTKLQSKLHKKHSSVAYHATRWAVVSKIIRVGKVHTGENLADALTKRLSAARRDYLFGNWTY